MDKIMAVYDVDASYAQRFADVVNQKEKAPFTVVPFTSLEALKRYAEHHPIEILLVSSGVPSKTAEEVGAKAVVALVEGEVVPVSEEHPSVYKYQSTDSVIREVMAYYCEKPQPLLVAVGKRAKVIGIYSPVSRCLKTSLALTMGQQLAREGKVLYIGFEPFAGFTALLEGECRADLSDVLYFFRQEDFGVMRLRSLVYTWKDMDYIPPVKYPEDLEQLTGEEAALLVEQIAVECGYGYLIVDMGQTICSILPVLDNCDVIFMPVKEDCVSAAKLEEFEKYLQVSKREDRRLR